MRRLHGRARKIAVSAVIALLAVSLAPQAARAAKPGSIGGTISGLTLKGHAEPVAVAYSLSGRALNEAGPAKGGKYKFLMEPGKVKVALEFTSGQFLEKGDSYGAHDASYWYSSKGPTTSWSKASVVTVKAGKTTKLNLKAVGGARVTATLGWNPRTPTPFCLQPVPAGLKDAKIFNCDSTASEVTKDAKSWPVTSTSMRPGTYIAVSTYDGKSVYYTGNDKANTKSASKAKKIKITSKTKTVKLGFFEGIVIN